MISYLSNKSRFKNALYNTLIVIFSLLFSLLIGILMCEAFFYIKNGNFFYKKSVHFKIQEKKNFIKNSFAIKETFKKYKTLNEKIFTIAKNQNTENEFDFTKKNLLDLQDSILVFGSWIKTEKPKKIKLNIIRDGILFESPYHSGNGKWEYLSVSVPMKYRFKNGEYSSDPSSPFIKTNNIKTLITSSGENFQYYVSPLILRPLRQPGSHYKYDVEYRKNNKIRVAILGGSTTFNIFIPPEDGADYPFLIQQMFDSLYPGKVDILNYGYPAANTRDFLNVAKELVFQEIDIVVIVPSWNDSGNYASDYYYKSKPIFSTKTIKYLESSFFNKVAVGYYLKKAMMRINQFQFKSRENSLTKTFNKSQSQGYSTLIKNIENKYFNIVFYNNLKQLVNFFKAENVEIILSNLPYLRFNNLPLTEKLDHFPTYKDLEASTNYTDVLNKMDNEVIPKVANEENIKFINLQKKSAFNYIDYSKRQMYFLDAVHFTKKGARIISYEIFKELHSRIFSRLYPKNINNLNLLAQKSFSNYDNSNFIKLKNGNFESKKRFKGNLNNWKTASENNSFRSEFYQDWRRNNSHAATSTLGKGKIISNKFTINSDHLFFMMRGKSLTTSKKVNFTGVKIYADDKLIKSISPSKNCEIQFCNFIINLKKWRNRIGQLKIIDGSSASKIQVDNFKFE